MKNDFDADYYRMTGIAQVSFARKCADILLRHNIRYMYFLRKAQQKKSFWTQAVLYTMRRKYGLEISERANIGPGLYLGHPYNITVAEETVIGKNVNLHKGCTIDRENRGKRKGMPVIGDNVFVGINATIVGNVHIGDDVVIAPNAFVNFDVPPHSVVIGNPGVIHPKKNATNEYVNFCV